MNVAIIGYGKMGKLVKKTVDEISSLVCVGIVSPMDYENNKEIVVKSLDDISGKVDVIIDFSHPSYLEMVEIYAEKNNIPVVLATTGYESEHIERINKLALKVPVVYTANFSLGITVFQQVLKQISPILKDTFDIEIIEKHHNQKLDSPSGTAKMLLSAVDSSSEFERVYGRSGMSKRGKEIGVHAVRGGTIAGEHTVMFAGEDEILEITHQAHSKQIFATGAVRAAMFAVNKKPGIYSMDDVLFGER